jgi:hypothetical protein
VCDRAQQYRFVCISAHTWLMISVLSRTSARARARAVGRPTPTSAIVPTMAKLRYYCVLTPVEAPKK